MILLNTFFDGALFSYVILPLLIFFARIMDVSIGTIRIVMVSKGHKLWAPILGFFEVFIWLIAMAKIFENLDNWICYFAYAGGFATGNYVGLKLEERLAFGIVKIQIITRKEANELINKLKSTGYGVTHHSAFGGSETVSIIYSIIKRTDIPKIEKIIKEYNPKAFFSIEDVKFVNEGVFPLNSPRGWRKGK